MRIPGFPFAAIVGQPDLRLALLLASVDWRLSVLLKGDKGSGKSTAARALADILPLNAPFVNIPIGTTEDRLLGGLDLADAFQGQARLKRGLIQDSHDGVLYIDEINLLADNLTDALLDVASSGRLLIERDGFSASTEARFILLGSMNSEEGSLRPQLLDRFALSLDVEAPSDISERASIVDRRMQFDADPVSFSAGFESEQQRLRKIIADARSALSRIKISREILQQISRVVADAEVRSLRADLAILRAALAHAALDQRTEISPGDIDAVAHLVLNHRRKRTTGRPPTSAPPSLPSDGQSPESRQRPSDVSERVFSPDQQQVPQLRINLSESKARGRNATIEQGSARESQSSGNSKESASVEIVASLTQTFRQTGTAALKKDHIVFRQQHKKAGVRFIFVVDSSGSQAAQQRMRAVKGAAVSLLESSVGNQDEVAVISFRGAKAEVVLQPCRDAEAAQRVLEFLPTGGRTPLAHALEVAASLADQQSLLILLTDGRANVATVTADPWADALSAAQRLRCPAVIVDSSVDTSLAVAMDALAYALQAKRIHLDELSGDALVRVLRPCSQIR